MDVRQIYLRRLRLIRFSGNCGKNFYEKNTKDLRHHLGSLLRSFEGVSHVGAFSAYPNPSVPGLARGI